MAIYHGEIKVIPNPIPSGTLFLLDNTYISILWGPGSISCGQYLDGTLGKLPPIYGPSRPQQKQNLHLEHQTKVKSALHSLDDAFKDPYNPSKCTVYLLQGLTNYCSEKPQKEAPL